MHAREGLSLRVDRTAQWQAADGYIPGPRRPLPIPALPISKCCQRSFQEKLQKELSDEEVLSSFGSDFFGKTWPVELRLLAGLYSRCFCSLAPPLRLG